MTGGSMKPIASTRAAARKYVLIAVTVMTSCFAGATALRPDAPARAQPAQKQAQPVRPRFTPESVVALARQLSSEPHRTRSVDNSPLQNITYDQYRDIRFNENAGIWRNEQVPFRIEVLPAGFLFRTPVTVALIENGYSREVTAVPGTFNLGPLVTKQLNNQTLPISGFRVRTRLNSRAIWDEFLVFQGASYFRAVNKGAGYGLSGRGLALHTAQPTGEEFPAFTRFWIERPAANAGNIVVHALLESESTTGAYTFSITPGIETVMDVDVTLFPRVALEGVGLAPLTSMFLFDESNRVRIDDFRDEVHDSDGLQVVLATGEQVWRPLSNPAQLQVSSFTSVAPKAFGLIQRSRSAADYQDFEAGYERRPSAWIEPTSEWGAGSVDLIEIPTDRETNDNIVAFWRPKAPIPAGKPWQASYRVHWTAQPKITPSLARISVTRTGPSFDGKRRVFVLDFKGAGRSLEGLRLDVGSSAGKLFNLNVQQNTVTRGVRASFEFDPGGADVAELRLRLMRADRPVSETWLYRWTPG
jgi:glucans biosynthesis protein